MWWLKVAAKIVLARVPVSYRLFSALGMFRHGAMDQASYALDVVFDHLDRVGGPAVLAGKTCLELGPGDSLASALIAHALSAKKSVLVDVGAFAEPGMETYVSVAHELARRGYATCDITNLSSTDEMLALTGAVYLTDGLASLRTIETGSIDIIWSQAVLEHVRLGELADVLAELRRILAPGGVMSHRIDYKDHLGGSLNNLRFRQDVWESEFMARSGFYTNRVRNSEFLRRIETAGFDLIDVQPGRWDRLPISRSKMAAPFRTLEEDDLLTMHVNVVAVPVTPR
jgi:SAM-dependent methyltransferase